MKLSMLRPSSFAAASLWLGTVIVLINIMAVAAYETPEILRLLSGQGILIALLASLLFFAYIFCILIGAVAGVVLSIVSFARREERSVAAVSGLVLNGSVLLLFAILFFGRTQPRAFLMPRDVYSATLFKHYADRRDFKE